MPSEQLESPHVVRWFVSGPGARCITEHSPGVSDSGEKECPHSNQHSCLNASNDGREVFAPLVRFVVFAFWQGNNATKGRSFFTRKDLISEGITEGFE